MIQKKILKSNLTIYPLHTGAISIKQELGSEITYTHVAFSDVDKLIATLRYVRDEMLKERAKVLDDTQLSPPYLEKES